MTDYVTKGSIARIRSGDCNFQPILQVLNIGPVKGGDGSSLRYRLVLSDGQDKIQSMPATQLNSSIIDGKLQQFTVIKATNFQTSNVNNQPLLILLAFESVTQLNYDISTSGNASTVNHHQQPGPNVSLYNPNYGHGNPNPSGPPSFGHSSAPSYGISNQPAPSRPTPLPAHTASSVYANYSVPPTAGSRPVVKDDHPGNVVPISAINPYSSKWTIKARITAKSEVRKWSNARGEGTLFSVDLLDGAGGEIRGTFFKEACEKFFPILQEGKVYTFSGGTLKVVQNRQYSSLKNNYEITFNQNSEIIPVHDDAGIKCQNFNFVGINAIGMTETNATIDLIGVVRDATDVSEIISTKQGGKTLLKRDLTIADDSGSEIKLTLWGDKASAPYDWRSLPIAAFKNVRVGDYGGKSLSSMGSTTITLNPDIPEGHKLYAWKQSFNGAIPAGQSLSGGMAAVGGGLDSFEQRKNIAAIKDEQLGFRDKPDFITLKGTVVYIKHDTDPFYAACPTPGCNKKVTEAMNGEYMCEKCNKTFPNCARRYILSVSMADHSGSSWFTLFNDTADILLKHSAEGLHQMKMNGDEEGYEKVFSDALFKTIIGKARVKQELVQEEKRVKSSFVKVEEVDYISECRHLLDAINRYQ